MRVSHWRIEATANSAVSLVTPTLGYEPVVVPKADVATRAAFVLARAV